MQGISFIAAPSTTVLSRRKTASAGPSRDRCAAVGSDKRNTLLKVYMSSSGVGECNREC